MRSRVELVQRLAAFVKERHPYEVPNITAVPIVAGNDAYLEWIRAETEAN